MPTARLKTGEIVQVPDGMDVNGVRHYLLENGASYEAVGLPPPPDKASPSQGQASGGLNPYGALAEAGGPLMRDVLAGARSYASQRVPGMTPTEAPDTLGGAIGQAAIPVGIGMALPGAGWAGVAAQGGAGAGLEALRSGSTPGSVAGSGLLGAGGAALGNMASRVATGIAAMAKSARGGTYLPTTSNTLRTLGGTTGGRALVENLNRKALTTSLAKSFGQDASAITPEVLLKGADDLSTEFQRLIPKNTVMDLTGPLTALQGTGKLGPKLTSLVPKNPTAATGQEWQDLRRALQDRITAARGSDNVLADDLSQVQDLLDNEAEAVLGPTFKKEFAAVREQWKNLKVAEELGSIKGSAEYATPAALSQKLASKYGTTYLRDAGGLRPETQALFDTTRMAAKDARGVTANSGTATRAGQVAGLGAGLGLLTGATTPEAAALAAATAGAGQLAGIASVGREATKAGATGAATAGALKNELDRASGTSRARRQ